MEEGDSRGLEEKASDGGSGSETGPWKDLGLAQSGASLADAAADWMRGPPLTHCWRLELCAACRPKPPLCLAVSFSLASSTPPSLLLSFPLVCSSSSSSSSSFFYCTHHHHCLQLHLLHTQTAGACRLLTHTQNCAYNAYTEYKKNYKLETFPSQWLKQFFPYLLTVVLPPVIKSQ